ncbi:MAG: hypothetical protein JOZ37_04605 [Actinobacteria bacterium]|nr:hypothetical protein [Actinomycetota bacterium]MBV9255578.1 hypothetical protein [Actinomycetota bacterium]MBV9663228.1 hypothetical protein [Actinomycetota bacterium]MBV9934606.1 hypothetical protein [Actinomycetota bacterium]
MRGGTGLTVAGAIGVAVAPVLPWARTGRAARSGFALAHLAQRLGLAHTWPLKALLFAVALLPLLAAVVWTAAALEWRWVMAALAAVAGGIAIAGAVIVWRSTVHALVGPPVGAVAGAAAVAGAVWTAIQLRPRGANGEAT